MTTEQYISKLDRMVNGLAGAFGRAVQSVHAETVQRIFGEGLNSAGAKIGTYNDAKPIYVNPATAPRNFKLRGKNSKSPDFKNGRQRKTGFFKSYKAFRSEQKRETGFVNLVLTGTLQSDYRGNAVKVNPFLYQAGVSNKANAKKIAGIEKKYGKIFAPTVQEKRYFNSILEQELKEALQ